MHPRSSGYYIIFPINKIKLQLGLVIYVNSVDIVACSSSIYLMFTLFFPLPFLNLQFSILNGVQFFFFGIKLAMLAKK